MMSFAELIICGLLAGIWCFQLAASLTLLDINEKLDKRNKP